MGGRRRLRAGLVRVSRDHRTATMQALRRHYGDICAELGLTPSSPRHLLAEANDVAMARLQRDTASRAWLALADRRATGTGRRPSEAAVRQAGKRAGMDRDSAAAAFVALRERVGPPRTPTVAELVAAQRAAGGGA